MAIATWQIDQMIEDQMARQWEDLHENEGRISECAGDLEIAVKSARKMLRWLNNAAEEVEDLYPIEDKLVSFIDEAEEFILHLENITEEIRTGRW